MLLYGHKQLLRKKPSCFFSRPAAASPLGLVTAAAVEFDWVYSTGCEFLLWSGPQLHLLLFFDSLGDLFQYIQQVFLVLGSLQETLGVSVCVCAHTCHKARLGDFFFSYFPPCFETESLTEPRVLIDSVRVAAG